MSDDDELKDDPDAKALRPLATKRVLIVAVAAGVVFGLLLATFGFILEHYHPRFRPNRPDEGMPAMPQVELEDAGEESSPWLQD